MTTQLVLVNIAVMKMYTTVQYSVTLNGLTVTLVYSLETLYLVKFKNTEILNT